MSGPDRITTCLESPFVENKLCSDLNRRKTVLSVHSYLVDPASGHMLISKIKPCMSKHELIYSEAANSSLQ